MPHRTNAESARNAPRSKLVNGIPPETRSGPCACACGRLKIVRDSRDEPSRTFFSCGKAGMALPSAHPSGVQPGDANLFEDISSSLASTLHSLSLSATASSAAFHALADRTNCIAVNRCSELTSAPLDSDARPAESSPSAQHQSYHEIGDSCYLSGSDCFSRKRRHENICSNAITVQAETKPRRLKETRRPPALQLAVNLPYPDAAQFSRAPTGERVKRHLRAEAHLATCVVTPVAPRNDCPGALKHAKRPLAHIAASSAGKTRRAPTLSRSPIRRQAKKPFTCQSQWGRASAAPASCSQCGRMLARGQLPSRVFCG